MKQDIQEKQDYLAIKSLRALVGSATEGEALPTQRELCARWDVTTFKLNQALRELEREGLLNVVPRKGVFVSKKPVGGRRFVQVLYLDEPRLVRVNEYALSALLVAAADQHLDCRYAHIAAADSKALVAQLNQVAGQPDCIGVIVSGYVLDRSIQILVETALPFTVLGDVWNDTARDDLPVVCGNAFQGALLACEGLLDAGCTRVILLNVSGSPDRIWRREARAGALEATERIDADVLLVPCGEDDQSADSAILLMDQWLDKSPGEKTGVLCSGLHFLQQASFIRDHLELRSTPCAISLIDVDPAILHVPNVGVVYCPISGIAKAAVTRLVAIRRGADAPGRFRMLFEAMQPERNGSNNINKFQ